MKRLLLGTVSLNSRHLTQVWLDSIAQSDQYKLADVLVVDNGSVEDVMSLQGEFPFAQFCRFEKHEGVAKAWNFILQYNQAEYVCVSNNDVYLSPTFAEQMIQFGDVHRDFGMWSPYCQDCRIAEAALVQSRFDQVRGIYKSTNQLYEVLRHVYQPWSPNLTGSSIEGFETFCQLMKEKYQGQVLPQVLGSCFVLRRQTLNEVGYFDESFLEGEKKIGVSEDFVMSRKLRLYENEKWKQMMDHSCPIFHYSSQTRKNHELMKQMVGVDGETWEAIRHQNTAAVNQGNDLRP